MFAIAEDRQNRILVLRLTGDVSFDDAPALMDRLEAEVMTQGVRVVALDLSHLGAICPTGLGAIIRTKTVADLGGRRLVLLAPSERIEKLMSELDIEGFFPSYDTEAELHGAVAEADGGTGAGKEPVAAAKGATTTTPQSQLKRLKPDWR
ncbi:MAG: STAS domain-containing protein [Desulfovibrio sp.]|jgi:anti-sigma B factor antagonist|nr:STAS domain-containing protein [Desulfovibrio sp.]